MHPRQALRGVQRGGAMRRVIIESPFRSATPEEAARNVRFARACLFDSLRRGEAPYASHLLFPQVLDDADAAQRMQGIEAGLAWGLAADLTAVYTNIGRSEGMEYGIRAAEVAGRSVEYRMVENWR